MSAALLVAVATGAVLVVSPTSVLPDPDGSAARPFRSIDDAVRAASPGDVVALAPGLFTQRVTVERPVTIRGPKAAVLVSPDATGIVVDVRAKATLEGFSVQGGAIGVRASAPIVLTAVDFSAQRRAAVQATGVDVEIRGGRMSALFDRPELTGVEVEGGRLQVRGARLDGPFRWAISATGAAMVASEIEVEGAVGGVRCVSGCRGAVLGAVLAQGRSQAILASAADLQVRESLVSRWEEGIVARDHATLTVAETAVAFCGEAGVTIRDSKALLRRTLHVGPASLASVAAIDSDLRVEGGLWQDPGATGIAVHRGKATIDGVVIRGARSEKEGDAVFAEKPEPLVLRDSFLEASSGRGLAVEGGAARLVGIDVVGCSGAGIGLARTAADLVGATVQGCDGVGLSATEGAKVRLSSCRFSASVLGPAAADPTSKVEGL